MDVFVHVPKTGGSTIRAILSRQYGVDRILYFEPGTPAWRKKNGIDDSVTPESFLASEVAKRGDIGLITGHYPLGVHKLLKRPCRYFTMLRDPIDRCISNYFAAYTHDLHHRREEITSGNLSFEKFLEVTRLEQVSLIAGAGMDRFRGSESKLATETLRQCFVAAGITERFEESILVIAKALAWKPPLFVMRNVTKLDEDIIAYRTQLQRDRDAYRRVLEEDYLLYEVAERLLDQQILCEADAFQTALSAFREIQADILKRSGEQVFYAYAFGYEDRLPEAARKYVGSAPYREIEAYLRDPCKAKSTRKNYAGHVDTIDERSLSGWATDITQDEPIEVRVSVNASSIGSTRCDRERADLRRAGWPNSRVGFNIAIPEPLKPGDAVDVFFEDSGVPLAGRRSRTTGV